MCFCLFYLSHNFHILILCSFSSQQTEIWLHLAGRASVHLILRNFMQFPCNMFDSILVMNYNVSIRLRYKKARSDAYFRFDPAYP